MTDPFVYSLIAASAYNDVRSRDENKIIVPASLGWMELPQYEVSNANGTGFSARVFKGPGGEVVISYAGTEFAASSGAVGDWYEGNVPLSLGKYGEQALEAARFYQHVKAEEGENITFTGHSLGGGLASLMAVWFSRPAKVFAAAPFQASADATQPVLAGSGVTVALYEVRRLLSLEGAVDPALATYDPTIDFIAREANVQAWSVKGEVLESYLGLANWIEGSSKSLLIDPASFLGSVKKHSIDLHAAALLSTTFNEWAAKIPTALPRIFDEQLYAKNPLGDEPDLLIKIVRNEVGAPNSPANKMLTHFAADLKKIGTNMANLEVSAQDALLAQAIEWYYWQPSSYGGDEFFTQNGGLLQYTTAKGDNLLGAQNKASLYVDKWLTPLLNDENEFGGNINYKQWNVNAGPVGVTATARDASKDQLFIGNTGADRFTGGGQADLMLSVDGDDALNGMGGNDSLYGGRGDDTLNGGEGADKLRGGKGKDTYNFDGSFGTDTIEDSDGSGEVIIGGSKADGAMVMTGTGAGLRGWDSKTDTNYALFGSTLYVSKTGVDGLVTINNWANGDLDIRLSVIQRTWRPIINFPRGSESQVLLSEPAVPAPDPQVVSPIALDLDGDGVETVGLQSNIYFDHAGDGFSELTGWVASDDGLLVRDLDGDGKITSGKELFGSESILISGDKARDGFAALAELDENHDGNVDANDAGFQILKIWTDSNQNGVTDSGELLSLANADVQSIQTEHRDTDYIDIYGNQHRNVGTYTRTDKQVLDAVDVWFYFDPTDSRVTTPGPEVSDAIKALPNIRGYGHVRSLHESMAVDSVLEGLVRSFATTTDFMERQELTRDILWRWTGADQKAASDRGDYIRDARWLYMVEAFTGLGFVQPAGVNEGTPDPGPVAAEDIYEVSRAQFEMMYSKLMAQTHLKDLYNLVDVSWDPQANQFNIDLSAVYEKLVSDAQQNPEAGLSQISEFARVMRGVGELSADTLASLAALPVLGPDGAASINSAPNIGAWFRTPVTGDEILIGSELDDDINGFDGNDTIRAQGGADQLIGSTGNDFLDGGAGNDQLYGNDGADTYVFGRHSGRDVIFNSDSDAPGAAPDVVIIGPNVAEAEVDISVIGDFSLRLGVSGTLDALVITNYLLSEAEAVDQIIVGATSWSPSDITAQLLRGTDGDDARDGWYTPDYIRGLAGNDTLQGMRGDDTLDGGAGNDVLRGGPGADTYLYARGDGRDTILNWDDDAYGVNLRSGQDANRDQVMFGAELTSDDIIFATRSDLPVGDPDYSSAESDDLIALVRNSMDRLLLRDFFSRGRIENFAFADGTCLSASQVLELIKRATGTEARDTLRGGDGADIIAALAGDDMVRGFGGNDWLDGGAGRDSLKGGEGDDLVLGGAGWDSLNGEVGNDTLIGGAGNDRSIGGAGDDVFVFGRGDGSDTIGNQGSVGNDTLRFGPGVRPEHVQLYRDNADLVAVVDDSSTQTRVEFFFTGSNGAVEQMEFENGTIWNATQIQTCVITGQIDQLTGTEGNDVFIIDNAADTVTEVANGGIDELRSSVSYLLPDNVENFTATGVLNLSIRGNSGNNILRGNASDNEFRSGGGDDRALGGAGDDTYIFDSSTSLGFTVEENADEGQDTLLQLSGSWTNAYYQLTLPDNVEHLIMGASSSQWVNSRNETTARGGYGNALDNLIQGDIAVENFLDGYAGRDTLIGGSKGDVFRVDREDDVIVDSEAYDSGKNDRVRTFENSDVLFAGGDVVESSAANYTLSQNLEHLRLIGAGATNGTGNALDNVMVGSQDVNRIDGGAGNDKLFDAESQQYTSDNDTLLGGEGDDQLTAFYGSDYLDGGSGNDVLTASGDRATLIGGAGDDTLKSTGVGAVYWYGQGDGSDIVDHQGYLDSRDRLVFRADILPEQVTMARTGEQGADLLLTLVGGGSVLVLGYFDVSSPGGYRNRAMESIEFEDGTVWSRNTVDRHFGLPVDPEGTVGNDVLVGTAVRNVLRGLEGNDTLKGDDGDDQLEGGDGVDVLDGGLGYDWLEGGLGNDVYRDADGSMQIIELEGGGTDTLEVNTEGFMWENVEIGIVTSVTGGTIYGGYQADTLIGNVGADTLIGNDGNDRLSGGAGSDFLDGGMGNDIFVFNKGDGQDLIEASDAQAAMDTLRIGALDSEVTASRSDNLLLLRISNSTDRIGFVDYYAAANNLDGVMWDHKVDRIEFINGVVWGKAKIQAVADSAVANRAPVVSSAIPILTAYQGSSFDYSIPLGTITDPDPGDTLTYSASLADGEMLPPWLSFNADTRAFSGTPPAGSFGRISLCVTARDPGNLSVSDVFDLTINVVNLNKIGTASADTLSGGDGHDTLRGVEGNDLLWAYAGNDLLDGGAGNDNLIGGSGNDTFMFSLGSGRDTVNAYDTTAGKLDVLVFNDVLSSAIHSLERKDNDLLIKYSVTDEVTVSGYFIDSQPAYKIEQFKFSDGVTWSAATVDAMVAVPVLLGTSLDDRFRSSAFASHIHGLEGNDAISGSIYSDFLYGGSGNDGVSGYAGNDWLYGELGDDSLYGGTGADTLVGGDGSDVYQVDNLFDQVIENSVWGGYDQVFSSVSYTMPMFVERVELTGAADIDVVANDESVDIFGNLGSNRIVGGAGNDTIDGGDGGVDTLEGGLGDDVYGVFYTDVLNTTIVEASNGGRDTVRSYVSNFTLPDNVEELMFAPEMTGLNANFVGNGGNNRMFGGNGSDALQGLAGNDSLYGGLGDDRYYFDRGDGVDDVGDHDVTTGNQDLLIFGSSIQSSQLWFTKAGNDLKISVIGTEDVVNIKNWYRWSAARIESLQADGDHKTLTADKVDQLVNAMAGFVAPSTGQTVLPNDYQTALHPVLTASWG